MAKITRTAVVDNDAVDTDEQGYEEESYEAPRTNMRKASTNKIAAGWGETETTERRETVKAPYLDFKNGDSSKVVKILDEQPFARWYRHFVPGKPPIYCHRDDCPICAKNWKANQNWRMNVIEMSDPKSATSDGWVVKVWDFSWPVVQQLTAFAEKMPLNDSRRYFQLMHIPNKGVTVVPLNSMALEDEHGLFPLTEAEVEAAQENGYGEESIFINTPKQVADIAAGLSMYVPKD